VESKTNDAMADLERSQEQSRREMELMDELSDLRYVVFCRFHESADRIGRETLGWNYRMRMPIRNHF